MPRPPVLSLTAGWSPALVGECDVSQDCPLESFDLAVALGCGSYNSDRTFFSVSAGRIKFADGGGRVSRPSGQTPLPAVAQLESAIA